MLWSNFWLAYGIGLFLVCLTLGFLYSAVWLKEKWDHYWWRKHYKPIQVIIPREYADEMIGWVQEMPEMRRIAND
jgi:hypothetical protein